MQARRPIRLEGGVNGRKLALVYGLLRNSTILLRKNLDSNSARRKLPYTRASLSSGLIVHTPFQPDGPLNYTTPTT